MHPRTLFFASVLAVTSTAFLACSSTDDPEPGAVDRDAGTSSGGGNGSSGSSSGGSGSSSSGGASSSGGSSGQGDGGSSGSVGPACYTPADAVGWTTQTQLAGSGNCTSAQIDALWTACGGATPVEAACTAATEAVSACSNCITGDGTAAERVSGFLAFGPDGISAINDVCEANAIGQAAECGSKRDNQDTCLVGACEACFETAANEPCQDAALAGPCAQFEPGVDCDALFEDDANIEIYEEICGDLLAEELSEADFKKAALYMCGPAQ